jgi:hypothetical protein
VVFEETVFVVPLHSQGLNRHSRLPILEVLSSFFNAFDGVIPEWEGIFGLPRLITSLDTAVIVEDDAPCKIGFTCTWSEYEKLA